jgi:hypothetical protein
MRNIFSKGEPTASTGHRAKVHIEAATSSGGVLALNQIMDQVGTGYYRFKVVEALRKVDGALLSSL